jgi:YD repeat-containing protein
MDLYDVLPDTGYIMNQVAFQYRPEHYNPVREIRTRSDGTQIDTYRYTVADLETTGTNWVLQEMKTGNILSPLLQEQIFLTRENVTRLISEKIVQYGQDSINGKRVYPPIKEFDLSLPKPLVVSSLPPLDSFTCPIPENNDNYSITKLFYDKPGKVYRLEECIRPGEINSIVHDKGNGKPVLMTKNTRRSEVDAVDRYRTQEISANQHYLMRDGILLAYFATRDNVMSILNKFLDKSTQIRQDDSFLYGELHQAMKSYAENFLYIYNDCQLIAKRDIILAHEYSLSSEYTEFLTRCPDSFNHEYLELAECVLNCAKYFTSERMAEFKFNVNLDLAGQNMGATLKVTPQDNLYNLYYVVNGWQGESGTFYCKAIYNDGSNYTFPQSFSIASNGWEVNMLEINLNEIPDREKIVSLETYPVFSHLFNADFISSKLLDVNPIFNDVFEAYPPFSDLLWAYLIFNNVIETDLVFNDLLEIYPIFNDLFEVYPFFSDLFEVYPFFNVLFQRYITLNVLVPAGTEFEAVSRDQLGRVFCKLNHLQQLERYEYDGLGRVVKVFDARGNVLQEFEYNEIALTN